MSSVFFEVAVRVLLIAMFGCVVISFLWFLLLKASNLREGKKFEDGLNALTNWVIAAFFFLFCLVTMYTLSWVFEPFK